jgi:glycosyltransferase involved in cell wall biosynthesis
VHILFLTHYFPPEVNAPASRAFEHSKHWIKKGHKVTIATCVPNHPQGKIYQGYKNRLFQRETRDGIEVIRLWTYTTANEGFFKRSLNYFTFMAMVIAALPILPKADVVISTSPQFFCGLAGYFLSRLRRLPWILEIRDLWPESIVTLGAIKNRFVIRVLEALELFAYRKANKVVALTEAFKNHMVAKGIQHNKIQVISNGVDLTLFRLLPRKNYVSDQLGLNEKFVVSYFGTHGMAHGLETVLNAAKELQDEPSIIFLLAGEGAEKKNLLKLRNKMQLRNVVILGQMRKEKMPYMWALSDVSMVLLKKKDLFRTVIPSKIFEAMAMSRPLILGVEGESKKIIQKANCGICIEPEDHKQLAAAVLKLLDNPNLCESFGKNGRRFVECNFNRRQLANDYLRVIGEVIESRIAAQHDSCNTDITTSV